MSSTPPHSPLPSGVPVTPARTKQPSPPLDTPLVRNENAQHDAFDDKSAKYRYPRYVEEARKFFVGPMLPMEFVNAFLPKAQERPPSFAGAFNSVPVSPITEEELYTPVVRRAVIGWYLELTTESI